MQRLRLVASLFGLGAGMIREELPDAHKAAPAAPAAPAKVHLGRAQLMQAIREGRVIEGLEMDADLVDALYEVELDKQLDFARARSDAINQEARAEFEKVKDTVPAAERKMYMQTLVEKIRHKRNGGESAPPPEEIMAEIEAAAPPATGTPAASVPQVAKATKELVDKANAVGAEYAKLFQEDSAMMFNGTLAKARSPEEEASRKATVNATIGKWEGAAAKFLDVAEEALVRTTRYVAKRAESQQGTLAPHEERHKHALLEHKRHKQRMNSFTRALKSQAAAAQLDPKMPDLRNCSSADDANVLCKARYNCVAEPPAAEHRQRLLRTVVQDDGKPDPKAFCYLPQHMRKPIVETCLEEKDLEKAADAMYHQFDRSVRQTVRKFMHYKFCFDGGVCSKDLSGRAGKSSDQLCQEHFPGTAFNNTGFSDLLQLFERSKFEKQEFVNMRNMFCGMGIYHCMAELCNKRWCTNPTARILEGLPP